MPIYHLFERDDADLHVWAEARRLSYSRFHHAQGFVIIATSEDEARRLASENHQGSAPWWLDPEVTACEMVNDDGKPRVVMGDWPTG